MKLTLGPLVTAPRVWQLPILGKVNYAHGREVDIKHIQPETLNRYGRPGEHY